MARKSKGRSEKQRKIHGAIEGLGLNGTLFFETIVPLEPKCPIFLEVAVGAGRQKEMGASSSGVATRDIRGWRCVSDSCIFMVQFVRKQVHFQNITVLRSRIFLTPG